MKITRNILVLCGLVMLFLQVPCVAVSQLQTVHPYLLFHNISEVPGYQYRTLEPWKQWGLDIVWIADNLGMPKDFSINTGASDRISYRGSYARDLGMAYQITKKPQYALKAKEALLNLDVGTVSEKVDKAHALGGYSLAYDFIQPTLDPATDSIIRDKLATLADSVYKDLNDNGSTRNYVSFADYHGRAYPLVGVAGAALSDYTNPNQLPLSSTPSDWNNVGTEYLFENDKLHSFGRSLFDFAFDESSGKYEAGVYKSYFVDEFLTWFQVYNHTYGENLLEKYPVAKKAFTTEVWDSLPNQYSSNYVTGSNLKWIYHRGIVSLLPDTEKSIVLNYLDRVEKSTLLPYSDWVGGTGGSLGISQTLLYSVYGNYTTIPRTFPANKSYLDPNGIFQVFRGSWNDDADWLSLVTFNKITNSNRDMAHHDQLSFEYYSRGDLLLADGGEDKYVLGKFYGMFETFHNAIAIEDPRTPFPLSLWAGSTSRGIYKGDASGIATPVMVDTVIQTPWIELIKTQVSITKVLDNKFDSSLSLSSPIYYERTILYPDSDYFIIVDRMEGTEAWTYRNIFRPTSLMITPTTDANKDSIYDQSEVGHVNGSLTLGSAPYNWESLLYKTETNTGIISNSFTWATKNPYGKDVMMNLYSAPSSEILVEKNVGRIAGATPASEVFAPIIWFRTPPSTSQYRVTALLSSYATEEAKTAQEIAVNGEGHAMKVHSSTADDYIYTGKGNSSFAGFTTDADTAFIHQKGNTVEITLLAGSYLDYQNERWVSFTKKADHVTVKKEKESIDYRIQAESDLRGELFNGKIDPEKIQVATKSTNQKITAITGSYSGTSSKDTFDIVSFLKKIAKQIISFLVPKSVNG